MTLIHPEKSRVKFQPVTNLEIYFKPQKIRFEPAILAVANMKVIQPFIAGSAVFTLPVNVKLL